MGQLEVDEKWWNSAILFSRKGPIWGGMGSHMEGAFLLVPFSVWTKHLIKK